MLEEDADDKLSDLRRSGFVSWIGCSGVEDWELLYTELSSRRLTQLRVRKLE